MLCASILLLTPLSLAISLSDFEYDVGVGQKCVTLGDPTDSKATIFGTQSLGLDVNYANGADNAEGVDTAAVVAANVVNTEVTLNGGGLARSVGYCSPVVTGSLGIKVTNNFKLSTELHVSNSEKVYLNDVVSAVSGVDYVLTASGAGAVAVGDTAANPAQAEAFILGTTGGKNDLYVEPKLGVAFKAEYQFGANANGATIGLAVARAADEFTYDADVLYTRTSNSVTQGTAGNAASHLYFQEDQVGSVTEESGHVLLGDQIARTTEKYDEAGFWVGAVASASAEITESVLLKIGAGYYMRDFDASKEYSNGVHFLVGTTESTMSMFNVSVTMSA